MHKNTKKFKNYPSTTGKAAPDRRGDDPSGEKGFVLNYKAHLPQIQQREH